MSSPLHPASTGQTLVRNESTPPKSPPKSSMEQLAQAAVTQYQQRASAASLSILETATSLPNDDDRKDSSKPKKFDPFFLDTSSQPQPNESLLPTTESSLPVPQDDDESTQVDAQQEVKEEWNQEPQEESAAIEQEATEELTSEIQSSNLMQEEESTVADAAVGQDVLKEKMDGEEGEEAAVGQNETVTKEKTIEEEQEATTEVPTGDSSSPSATPEHLDQDVLVLIDEDSNENMRLRCSRRVLQQQKGGKMAVAKKKVAKKHVASPKTTSPPSLRQRKRKASYTEMTDADMDAADFQAEQNMDEQPAKNKMPAKKRRRRESPTSVVEPKKAAPRRRSLRNGSMQQELVETTTTTTSQKKKGQQQSAEEMVESPIPTATEDEPVEPAIPVSPSEEGKHVEAIVDTAASAQVQQQVETSIESLFPALVETVEEEGALVEDVVVVPDAPSEAQPSKAKPTKAPTKKADKKTLPRIVFQKKVGGRKKTVKKAQAAVKAAGATMNIDDLPDMDPPPAIPKFPTNLTGDWSIKEDQRVIYADFSHLDVTDIPTPDKDFFFRMMERDDFVLISKGLVSTTILSLDELRMRFTDIPAHKFKVFQRHEDGHEYYVEEAFHVALKVDEYMEYWRMREEGSTESFTFSPAVKDSEGYYVANVSETAIYMTDVEMPVMMSSAAQRYRDEFRIKEILPGGELCLMRPMSAGSCPAVGPNIYVTPCGAFTAFHQDGHGTIDSGHTCLSGFNEVIMFRRMSQDLKKQVMGQFLYHLPHDGIKDGRRQWMTAQDVKDLNAKNYCVSACIVGPGEHVHINKSRFHAFRKTSLVDLPQDDAHYALRQNIHAEHGREPRTYMNVSIAFDWMYRGYTAEGVEQEVNGTYDCSRLCRDKGQQSLAIPATCIVQACRQWSALALPGSSLAPRDERLLRVKDLAAGMAPVCRQIWTKEQEYNELLTPSVRKKLNIPGKLREAPPDAVQNPMSYSIDPHGNDYYCGICRMELPNTYFHCQGCEELLNKDYNVCGDCYRHGKHLVVGPGTGRRISSQLHTAQPGKLQKGRGCSCHEGICDACKLCRRCSCACHYHFVLARRWAETLNVEKIEETARAPDEATARCIATGMDLGPPPQEQVRVAVEPAQVEETTDMMADEEMANI